ncbi:MAG: LysR substrate-binding domain-containing protein, partial [Myxococcota bacterium]
WGFPRDPRWPEPRVRLTVNAVEASIGAAIAGRGLLRATSYQVADAVRSGSLVMVLDRFAPPAVPVHVVHDGGRASHRVRLFVDHAVDALRATLAA